MITVSQARIRARYAVMKEYSSERSEVGLHYLGLFKRKHAFEVFFKLSEDICADMGLPIVVLVTASIIQVIQSDVCFDILDYFREKNRK